MAYPYDIPVSFLFNVKVDGISGDGECSFQEVSGLNVNLPLEECKEGGVNNYIQMLPGRAKYDSLVLKRGLLKGSSLITWVNNAVSNFVFVPKLVEVMLVDTAGNPVITWALANAYPVAVKMDEFKALGNNLAIESLHLSYSYFTRTN
jgi:phage tail-like protein